MSKVNKTIESVSAATAKAKETKNKITTIAEKRKTAAKVPGAKIARGKEIAKKLKK
jgi:hypothetical protein